jgi:hypothetical protein
LDVLRAVDIIEDAAIGLCSLHLGELGHVSVAQHQADVGMRNQPPLRADHIGVAVLADPDLGDNVPDQLQIDFRNADAGVLAGAGDSECHVRLGLSVKVHRPVIDLVREGFGEFRLVRKIDAAVDHIYGDARDPQALLAAGIDLRELGDGRHLVQ